MFDKNFLVNKVVNSLQKENYEVLVTEGCFDIAAKRENLLLIKVLMNVDALQQEQAVSLRAVAYFLSAHPFVVSTKNNRESLDDDMVYSRFEVPVTTPKLFDAIVMQEGVKTVQSAKGKHTVNIDTKILRDKRKELEFTLETLANKIGISKKALYEIENNRVNPTRETVEKLENILFIDLQKPYEMKSAPMTYLKPKSEFQEKVSKEFSRIGIENSSVYSAPFELVGKENFSIITNLSKTVDKIKREAGVVKKLSTVFSSKAVFVAKKSTEKSVEGVAVVLESELPEIETTKELSKIIEEKE